MLCVVDDAHWLDPATADALLFCARRLGADRVLLVFAARDGDRDAVPPRRPRRAGAGRPRPGRCPGPARASAGGARCPEVADRLVVETGGNPLALLELPTGLSAAQLAGAAPLPHPAAPDRPRRAGLPRPQPSAAAAGAVAAAAGGRRRHRRPRQSSARAASTLGVDEQALEDAVASGLLVLGRRTRARCGTRWCARPSTRRPPADQRRGATAPWPTPWPASATPTGRPGTAPPPPRDPTPTSPPPSRSSGRVPSVAARTSLPLAAYERAAALTPATPQRADADARGRAERVGVRADRPRTRRCWPPPASSPPTRCCSATSPGSGAASRSTSAPRPTRTGSSPRPRTRPRPSTRPALEMAVARRHHAHLRRRQRRHPGAGDLDVDVADRATRRAPCASSTCSSR